MKKWTAAILVPILVTTAFGSQAFAAGNSDAYANAAEKLVNKYVTKLQNSDYESSEILTKLVSLKSQYIKKTKLRSYRGVAKKRIDAIIGKIDQALIEVQEDINEEKNDPLSNYTGADTPDSAASPPASGSTWKVPKVVSNEKKGQIGKCYTVASNKFGSDESNYLQLLPDSLDTWSTTDKEKCATACRESIGNSIGYMCLIKGGNGTDASPNFNVSLSLKMEKQSQNEANPTAVDKVQVVSNKTMHVIGVYEGIGHKEQGAQVTPGKVTVKITKSIGVLVLSSYKKTEWNLDIAPGVTIEQIITNGFYNQKVVGNGSIPIMQISIENNNSTDWLGAPYSEKPTCSTMKVPIFEELPPPGTPGYQEGAVAKKIGERDQKNCERDFYELSTKKNLKRLTQLDITSFQGGYTGESFEIK